MNIASASLGGRSCTGCVVHGRSDWASLPPHTARILDRVKHHRSLRVGEALFWEGDRNTGVYCLSSGVIGLRMVHSNGTDVLVSLAWPGDTLGARAFLRNGSHRTSAVALTDAGVCTIRRRDALRLTQDAPNVHLALVERCLTAMDGAQQELLDAAARSTRARLCATLLRMNRAIGGGRELTLPVSRADLAGMLAVQPESLSRLFRKLKDDGVIRYSGRNVEILSMARLEAEVEA